LLLVARAFAVGPLLGLFSAVGSSRLFELDAVPPLLLLVVAAAAAAGRGLGRLAVVLVELRGDASVVAAGRRRLREISAPGGGPDPAGLLLLCRRGGRGGSDGRRSGPRCGLLALGGRRCRGR
jgi:hypothetical protein